MDKEDDLTVAILREIRDEIRGTNVRLDSTRIELVQRIDGTNARIDGTNERIDETNQRLETVEDTLKDLAGQQLILTRYVKNVVERHDTRIEDLQQRVTRIETKLGT